MKWNTLSPLFPALLVCVAGCGDTADRIEVQSIEQIHDENGVPVVTRVVEPEPLTRTYTFYSVLSGIEETSAMAPVTDEISRVNYTVGDLVEKDAVVVTFPTDNPSTGYNQTKVAYEHARTTLERIGTLFENGGVSRQEYDNTRTQFDVAKANWDAVQQSVMVTAPIGGTLTSIGVRESDNVSAGDALFTVANTQTLRTRLWVTETQVADIAVGDSASATWRGSTIGGTVVRVDLSMDPAKQAYGVELEFENTERLTSGVNADIAIRGRRKDDAIVVERKNIFNDGDSDYVFIAENGAAVKRTVTTGAASGLEVEILRGLASGDMLITEGQLLLEDGMKINVEN